MFWGLKSCPVSGIERFRFMEFLCRLPLAWKTPRDIFFPASVRPSHFLVTLFHHSFLSHFLFFQIFSFCDKVPIGDTRAPGSTPF